MVSRSSRSLRGNEANERGKEREREQWLRKEAFRGFRERVSFSLVGERSHDRSALARRRVAVASTFITCGKSRNSIMRLTSNSNTIRRLRREGAVRASARARRECFVRRLALLAAPRRRSARARAIHDPRGSSRGYIIPAHNLGGISHGSNNTGNAFHRSSARFPAFQLRALLRFRDAAAAAVAHYRLSTRRDRRIRAARRESFRVFARAAKCPRTCGAVTISFEEGKVVAAPRRTGETRVVPDDERRKVSPSRIKIAPNYRSAPSAAYTTATDSRHAIPSL